MPTVPHPTPLAHLSTALDGTDDARRLAWRHACDQVAQHLRTPQNEPVRLGKALTLAQQGHVTLTDDNTATVLSSSSSTLDTVDGRGQCTCPHVLSRGQLCTHALAVSIHRHALMALGDTTPTIPRTTPTPTSYEPAPRGGWPSSANTAARWDVTEAPASACVKFRVGTLEMTYTFRGQTDAEVLPRCRATLPAVQALGSTPVTRGRKSGASAARRRGRRRPPQRPQRLRPPGRQPAALGGRARRA